LAAKSNLVRKPVPVLLPDYLQRLASGATMLTRFFNSYTGETYLETLMPIASPDATRASLSVIIPAFNEAPNVQALYRETSEVLARIGLPWQIIFVNDGSRDNTLVQLVALAQQDRRVMVIDLARNFGKEVAISAGIDHATGGAIIPMDADLQHPPSAIIDLVDKWREGASVVFAVRRSREKEGWFKGLVTKAFYRLLGTVTDKPIPLNIGDFCLLDERVAQVLRSLPERNRFMKGLFAWVGFKQAYVEYDVRDRAGGQTKWNYWRLWNFAIEGITSFSTIPLKVWSYVGLVTGLICLVYAIFIIIQTFIYGVAVPGYASLMVAILFMGSVKLIGIGTMGEYVGRIYTEVRGRPLYVVNKVYGKTEHDATPK
jgi:glycosyltransferase involved in cell wall biosynthesis